MSEGVIENQIEKTGIASTDLRTNLEEIFKANVDTYGHGTRVETAEEIIGEGLRSRTPDLTSTALVLFDHGKTFEEQIDGVMKKIENWPHLELRAIVIIMLPRIEKASTEPIEPKSGVIQIRGQDIRTAPFFRKIPGEHDASYGLPYILPPNYIKGFIDVEKNEFIKNPLFNPTPPEPIVNQVGDQLKPKTLTKPVANNTPPLDLLP